MREKVFRIIAGILGIAFVSAAIPISKYAPSDSWPSWVHLISFFLIGGVFLVFAITGRAWPSAYGRKVFGDDDSDDR